MTNHLYDGVFAPHATSEKAYLITAAKTYSYAEFTTLTNRLANRLVAAGVGAGDRVAVQADKSVTQLALYAATVKVGGIYLPLNTAYTAHELEYFLGDAKPAVAVVSNEAAPSITPITDGINAALFTLQGDETGTMTDGLDSAGDDFDAVARDPDDLGAILYTSGTTGRSKGAKLSHRNLLSNATILMQTWHFTGDDVLLHMLPIYHTHGLFVACNLMTMAGGTMIFLPKFNLEAAITHMPQSTAMMGVPTFYTRLLDSPEFTAELTEHMRLFISGSAPLLAETHEQFSARTGQAILERYGMTETNMNTSNPYYGERRAGTVGKPLTGVDIRITNPETGETLGDGEIGVIELKGDNVFSGYWEMPEKTAESFTKDGYFITGDMAQRSKDGYISIVGRDKDMIISGGLNIYPIEIEGLIDEVDGVVESAVIGVPHKDFGEAVVAVIATKDAGLTAEKITAHVGDKLARFKQPKQIFFVETLPRNTMGKVQKATLRKTHEGLFV